MVLRTCFSFLQAALLSLSITAQVDMPATTQAGILTIKHEIRDHPGPVQLTEATQGSFPTALIHGRCMVGFLGRVNGAFLQPADLDGVMIGARIGDVISFRVDAYQLDALHSIPGLEYAELAGKVVPALDKLVRSVRADSVHAGINLPSSYTGAGVLIGITDWGFDYTHPMFLDTSLTQPRVRAAWDHYRQAGPSPAGFDYGTEMTTTAQLLAAGSDTANIYSYSTHGTHVAGIAGGSGVGTDFRGVAFDAQFLFNTFLVDAAAVLDAFAWMKGIADQDQKRLVVNMSWGLHHIGTLDGTSLLSQSIDQLSTEGVVFVSSAGNNGNVDFHIKKSFANDTLRSRIQFYPYSAHPRMWGQSISMWGEAGHSFSAGFMVTNTSHQVLQESPLYHSATQTFYLDSMIIQGADTVFFNLTTDAAHPLNGRPHFRLRVKNTSSQINVVLKATAEDGIVHLWNVTELTNDVGNWGQAFLGGATGWTVGDEEYGISEPACAESALTVAAFNTESYNLAGNLIGGSIAGFSSHGPTLDERMKPDFAAPGVNVASSISSFTDASYTTVQSVSFQGVMYRFARFSGTSMSSPAVAGVVALLLEADPDLSPAEVRALLRQTARTDATTGTIPPGGSTRWGAGKVNAYQALVELLGLTTVAEHAGGGTPWAWPNPATNELHVVPALQGSPSTLTIVDATGREVHRARHLGNGFITLYTGDLTPGLFLLIVEQDGQYSALRFVKE